MFDAIGPEKASETYYSKILIEDDTYARAYYFRGSIRYENLDYDSALDDFRKAVKYASDADEKAFYVKELAIASEKVRHKNALDKIHNEL